MGADVHIILRTSWR